MFLQKHYYISLFSGGGEGSLIKLIKSTNLASTLAVGVSSPYRNFTTLYMTFGLTDLGVKDYRQVVKYVFEVGKEFGFSCERVSITTYLKFLQFINILRKESPEEWFWDEAKLIAELGERFKIRDAAVVLVSTLGKLMLVRNSGPNLAFHSLTSSTCRRNFQTTPFKNT